MAILINEYTFIIDKHLIYFFHVYYYIQEFFYIFIILYFTFKGTPIILYNYLSTIQLLI